MVHAAFVGVGVNRLFILVQVRAAGVRQAARGPAEQGAAERCRLRPARYLGVLLYIGAGAYIDA